MAKPDFTTYVFSPTSQRLISMDAESRTQIYRYMGREEPGKQVPPSPGYSGKSCFNYSVPGAGPVSSGVYPAA
jgi:hypothetical protein